MSVTDPSTDASTDARTDTGPATRPDTGPDSGPATGTGAGTGAHTEEAAVRIDDARRRIDVLDERIIALVRDRMSVSAAIQDARVTSGGHRVSLSREMEVLSRYRDSLGRPGTALAMTLLELSRGRV